MSDDTDDTDDHEEYEVFDGDLDGGGDPGTEEIEEEPPSYHSGRVRIIGAEPAGDTVREVTGPVVDEHPELPHWNDAPTGQVPAVLDRSNGEEQLVAPPTWREEENDWEAQEEVFEPSMLSEDLPAVGALLNEQEEFDVERQPWHFESDDTLVIPPEPGSEPEPPPVREPEPVALAEPPSGVPDFEPEFEPSEVSPRVASPVTAAASAAAATRLSPPQPPEPRARSPRTTRSGARARTGNVHTAGTGGRDMRVAIGTGVLLGVVALLCFAAGNVATMAIVCVVVLLATAEAYAAFRRAHYHPATLLGLVAVLSLLIETYNKGVAALPLVLVLLVAGSFVWYLVRVEPAAEPVSGITSTVFVFVWVGAFGSFAALLLDPNLFPDRHGIAFILAAVIVTVADDIASLLVGSAMGRHQLAPSISPNKSWEGLIGGAVAAILVSVIVVHFIHPWTIGKAALYGVVVAVVAPLGDLSQSMIKRNLGLKDMGRLLPGHGGILDRVDGLLFVIPATYFVVKAMHLG
ncbi:MAG: phosphatidate cytidylyltransferase [Acidimicrobiales bacterium]